MTTRRKRSTEGVEIHVYLHDSASVTPALATLLTHIVALSDQVTSMDATTQAKLDALAAAVAKLTTIEQSVETLLNGLSAQIAELKKGVTDPAVIAAIDAASAIVADNNAKFVAAVTANTPT